MRDLFLIYLIKFLNVYECGYDSGRCVVGVRFGGCGGI